MVTYQRSDYPSVSFRWWPTNDLTIPVSPSDGDLPMIWLSQCLLQMVAYQRSDYPVCGVSGGKAVLCNGLGCRGVHGSNACGASMHDMTETETHTHTHTHMHTHTHTHTHTNPTNSSHMTRHALLNIYWTSICAVPWPETKGRRGKEKTSQPSVPALQLPNRPQKQHILPLQSETELGFPNKQHSLPPLTLSFWGHQKTQSKSSLPTCCPPPPPFFSSSELSLAVHSSKMTIMVRPLPMVVNGSKRRHQAAYMHCMLLLKSTIEMIEEPIHSLSDSCTYYSVLY